MQAVCLFSVIRLVSSCALCNHAPSHRVVGFPIKFKLHTVLPQLDTPLIPLLSIHSSCTATIPIATSGPRGTMLPSTRPKCLSYQMQGGKTTMAWGLCDLCPSEKGVWKASLSTVKEHAKAAHDEKLQLMEVIFPAARTTRSTSSTSSTSSTNSFPVAMVPDTMSSMGAIQQRCHCHRHLHIG